MSGSVGCYKGSWYVRWWDRLNQKDVKIYRYNGFKLESQRMADKLLLAMQTDIEKGTFYLEKYKKPGFSDTINFIENWLDSIDGLSPATHKGYKSYIKNHIKPFFVKHSHLSLPDIQIDVLRKFRKGMEKKGLSPKMQWNVMFCLHAILHTAWESRRIQNMPPFPRKKEYSFVEKKIEWLPESRQLFVIEQIPEIHQPIFYFLKYHLRRPGEAIALHKEDYEDGVFTIRRSVSARKVVNKTKTGEIHTIPCHPDFEQYIEKEKRKFPFSPFFFTNPAARRRGKRYTNEVLNIIWKAACKKAGEDIDLYSGLKHSSCSQYINEKGLSESELQIITDHANLKSVKHYAKTEIKRKKELMVKNVFKLQPDNTRQDKAKNNGTI